MIDRNELPLDVEALSNDLRDLSTSAERVRGLFGSGVGATVMGE